jgi:hypothetical protein
MPNRFWVGGTGAWDNTSTTNWSATTGGAGGASAPTAADDVFFDASSGTAAIVTIQASALGRTVNVDKSDITLLLAGSPTFANIFTFTQGTLDLAGNTLTALRFSTSNSNTRTIAFGAGSIVVTGNAATVVAFQGSGLTLTGSKNIVSNYSGATGTRTFSMSATGTTEDNVPNIAITAGTDTVASLGRVRTLDFTGFNGTYNSAATKTLFGGLIFDPGMTITGSANNHSFAATTGPFTITTAGLTLDFPLQFSGNGGTWAFSDALTQGVTRNFIVGASNAAGTVQLKANATSTVGVFSTSGALQKYLQSTLPGTRATLSQASGTVNATSLTIQDIAATGGATWNAYVDQNNVDAGNNTGWNFGLSPTVLAYELPYEIRSFTQPRRF